MIKKLPYFRGIKKSAENKTSLFFLVSLSNFRLINRKHKSIIDSE